MNLSDPENSENEFSIKFKEEYKKMLEKEKEYTEHLQNCDLKYKKITRSILKNDLSKEDIYTKK